MAKPHVPPVATTSTFSGMRSKISASTPAVNAVWLLPPWQAIATRLVIRFVMVATQLLPREVDAHLSGRRHRSRSAHCTTCRCPDLPGLVDSPALGRTPWAMYTECSGGIPRLVSGGVPVMDVKSVLAEVSTWTPEERVQLVHELWDRVAGEDASLELSEAMKAEIDRRLAAHAANPEAAIPWEQVEADALARFRQ